MLDFEKYYFFPMCPEEYNWFGWLDVFEKKDISEEDLNNGYMKEKMCPFIKLNELKDYLATHKKTVIYKWVIEQMDKEYQDCFYSLNIKTASDTWMYNKDETISLLGEEFYKENFKS
jgi:hypothetical protein